MMWVDSQETKDKLLARFDYNNHTTRTYCDKLSTRRIFISCALCDLYLDRDKNGDCSKCIFGESEMDDPNCMIHLQEIVEWDYLKVLSFSQNCVLWFDRDNETAKIALKLITEEIKTWRVMWW